MKKLTQQNGRQLFEQDRARMMADPELAALYREEGAKKALWLQIIEARQAAGLSQAQLAERLGVSQAQIARLEKQGYDAYTLTSLRRYINALGGDFVLDVTVRSVDVERPVSTYPNL